jgi:hypothetical protein
MAEFIAFDPNVETLGHAIKATVEGMGSEAEEVMARHGLMPFEPDHWYPQQSWLDALKEMGDRGMLNLVAVGLKIPETAAMPPDILDVESALAAIDVAYHMNHRGGEIGYYKYESVGDKHVKMICKNPYPSDFDYGLIYGFTRRYLPAGADFVVERQDSPSRVKGDDTCIYDVTWK